jgi:DNA polymerase-3 subunit alpha
LIQLHCHTAKGSLLDSTNTAEELAKKAKEHGAEAIAITDHGMTSATIDFYKACKEEGIKPLLGCEVYVTEDVKIQDNTSRYDHLIMIAKNLTGYRNLLKIVTLGFTDGFYYKPRVDRQILEQYAEGLVVTSACLGATIPKMIRKGMSDIDIIQEIEWYKNTFEDYFLEVQPAGSPEQAMVNIKLAELSPIVGVPLIATCDVHFLNEEDHDLHGVFIQIAQDRDNEVYKDCWMKPESVVFNTLEPQIGMENALEAIANTHKVADMCDVELELGKSYLPKFPIPSEYKSEGEYLRFLCNRGFARRGLDKLPPEERQVYINRMKEEFDIITAKGFGGYFLIVSDFLSEMRDKNIYTGDGRGSADNSLVCYVLEITNVDPILYDLIFSRFLTMERVELPDIDMDIQSSHKPDAINILREKYGSENVAQICSFQTLASKAIIDAIGKVLGLSYKETTEIKKHIPDKVGLPIKEDDSVLEYALLRSATLRIYQEKYPKLFEYALRLESLPRSLSVHAGGVVICPSDHDMSEFTALAFGSKKEIITQLEMHNVEEVGLVKMDCLGIKTLDVVANTLDRVFPPDGHNCFGGDM